MSHTTFFDLTLVWFAVFWPLGETIYGIWIPNGECPSPKQVLCKFAFPMASPFILQNCFGPVCLTLGKFSCF